jgi:hypothetical protein
MVPIISNLPTRTLFQIAFFRPITGVGSHLVTSPVAISAIQNALSVVPGISRDYIRSHSTALSAVIRLIVWIWLGVSTFTTVSLLSFVLPFIAAILGYIGHNHVWLEPIATSIVSLITTILPGLAWDLFSSVANWLVSALTYAIQPSSNTVREVSMWTLGLISITELFNYWILPFVSMELLDAVIGAIGNFLLPFIPSLLVPALTYLSGGIILIILSPIHFISGVLPILHGYLWALPGSLYVWNAMKFLGSWTLGFIPVELVVELIKRWLGM